MQIPDPLRPYVGLLQAGLWCVLACGLFVTGCNHGKDSQQAESQKAVSTAETQRDAAQTDAAENLRAANACGQLLEDVNRQTQSAIDAAASQRAAADEAARRAVAAAAESQRRATAAERALQESKTQWLRR
jgi:hypothetical protein